MSLTENDRAMVEGAVYRLRQEVLHRMYQFERDYVARPGAKQDGDIAGLDYGMEACITAMVEMQGSLDAMGERVDKLEAGFSGLLGKVVSLSGRVTSLEGRVTALEGKL